MPRLIPFAKLAIFPQSPIKTLKNIMNINDFKRKIQEKQAEITKAIHRTLPIKIGRKAADHFQDNFRKGGFAVGHPPTPVSLATPPRPVPSSPKTTPISQKTATTAPSTNPTSSPDYAHSSRRKPKIATTVHSSMDVYHVFPRMGSN